MENITEDWTTIDNKLKVATSNVKERNNDKSITNAILEELIQIYKEPQMLKNWLEIEKGIKTGKLGGPAEKFEILLALAFRDFLPNDFEIKLNKQKSMIKGGTPDLLIRSNGRVVGIVEAKVSCGFCWWLGLDQRTCRDASKQFGLNQRADKRRRDFAQRFKNSDYEHALKLVIIPSPQKLQISKLTEEDQAQKLTEIRNYWKKEAGISVIFLSTFYRKRKRSIGYWHPVNGIEQNESISGKSTNELELALKTLAS